MAASIEDISSTKKRLTIEIPGDVIDREYKDSLARIRQKANIPGFRPGKAPVNLIEKKFEQEIKSDLVDRLIPKYYTQAMKEADLFPVAMPDFEGDIDINKSGPLSFALTVEVMPKIDNLAYTGLKVEDIPVQVEGNEIDETMKGLREGKAVFEVVDREVREDDLLVIDYAKLDPSGTTELSSAKDQILNLGNKLTPKGILDGVVGRRKGETCEIVLPSVEGEEIKDDDQGNRLRITIREIKEKKLPPVDDEFAKDLGFDTVDALREKIREGILQSKKDKAAGSQKAKLLEALVAGHNVEVPDAMLKREIENLELKRLQGNQAGPGDAGPEEDEAKTGGDLRQKALHNVRASLILAEIAEKEKVTVTDDELKARINLLARHFQTKPENVINLFVTKDGSLDNLRSSIREEKVLDLVLSKADVVGGA